MRKLFPEIANKKVLILGFGREGISTYKLLRKSFPKKTIAVADKKVLKGFDLEVVKLLKKDKKLKLNLGKKYLDNLSEYDVIIKSPGISAKLPSITRAQTKGVSVTSQTKIFFDKCKGKIIGVTGTKGKSTTATLIYEILKKAGRKVFLVGNIEAPVFDFLGEDSKDTHFVYELSSHQLSDLNKSPYISVMLNLGIDHLDWHGSQKHYINAKKNIVKHQKKSDFAVLNGDDVVIAGFKDSVKSQKIWFSTNKKVIGAYIENGKIILNIKGKRILVGNTNKLCLKGKHNWSNVLAAICASYLIGVDLDSIRKIIFSFKGLEHRLEYVAEIGDITFINDSMSTNQISTKAAIDSFIEPLTLILGGYDRGIEYDGLCKEIVKRNNVKTIILIGDIANRIKSSLNKTGYQGTVVEMGKPKMVKIIKKAHNLTPNGGIVLFSPGAASFDMFENYKDRGKQFKTAVKQLK